MSGSRRVNTVSQKVPPTHRPCHCPQVQPVGGGRQPMSRCGERRQAEHNYGISDILGPNDCRHTVQLIWPAAVEPN